MRLRFRLFWRLLASMIVISTAVLSVQFVMVQRKMTEQLHDATDEQIELHLDRTEEYIAHLIGSHVDVMRTTVALPDMISMDPQRQEPVLVAVSEANKAVSAGLNTIGPDGVVRTRGDGKKPGGDLSQRAYFQQAMKGADPAYQVVIGQTDGKATLIIAMPIKQNGTIVGVLYSNVSLDGVAAYVSSLRVGQTGYVWLVDAEDTLMAHPDATKVQALTKMTEHPAVARARAGNDHPQVDEAEGKRWVTSQRTLAQGFVLVLQIAEDETLAPVKAANDQVRYLMLGLLAGVGVLAFVTARSISAPMGKMAAFVTQMAQGDFTGELSIRRSDELGEVAASLVQMQQTLGQHIKSVHGATGGVSGTAYELRQASDRVATAQRAISGAFDRTLADVESLTGQQQERLSATKRSVTELVAAVDQIARSATHQAIQVNQASQAAEQVAQEAQAVSTGIDRVGAAVKRAAGAANAGKSTVEAALVGIQATKVSVDSASQTVHELGLRSEGIAVILEEIGAIAAQTNMLALNAAIEAARAGEAGRGFAVVAEEVRRLADRSVQSTAEINTILAALQTGVKQAVAAMEQGASTSGEGATKAIQAQEALNAILRAVAETTAETEAISGAVASLVAQHERLAEATQTLAAVTEENTAAAEEMAAGSETVKEAVETLDTLAVQNFAAIQGVGEELAGIDKTVGSMLEAVGRLDSVNQALTESVQGLKA